MIDREILFRKFRLYGECPCCHSGGPFLQQNVSRHQICSDCGNIFMRVDIARRVCGNSSNYRGDYPQIDAQCPIPTCKSIGPFVVEQGTSTAICVVCGNYFMPLGAAKDLMSRFTVQPKVFLRANGKEQNESESRAQPRAA